MNPLSRSSTFPSCLPLIHFHEFHIVAASTSIILIPTISFGPKDFISCFLSLTWVTIIGVIPLECSSQLCPAGTCTVKSLFTSLSRPCLMSFKYIPVSVGYIFAFNFSTQLSFLCFVLASLILGLVCPGLVTLSLRQPFYSLHVSPV